MAVSQFAVFGALRSLTDNECSKILGWPAYRVCQHEINAQAKTLKLWVRRKRGNRKLVCAGCGRRVEEIHEVYEREVRDLPCFEFRTTVVIELYRLRCPDCGIKAERVPQLPGKAPFSKRFQDMVGEACESAPARRVARRFGLAASTVRGLTCAIWSAGEKRRMNSSAPNPVCGSGRGSKRPAWICGNPAG